MREFYRGMIHHPDPWASVCGPLFLEGAWSDTFDFSFTGFYAVVPYVTLEVQASLLLLLFL